MIIILLILNVLILDLVVFFRLIPRVKGFLGELFLHRNTNSLDKKYYKIYKNLLFKGKYCNSQIDEIIVSKYGIFLIEMKNYSGVITGHEFANTWTQHFGSLKYSFRNPQKQNYGHMMTFKELFSGNDEILLKRVNSWIVPVVVFSDKTILKIQTKGIVLNKSKLVETIKSYKEVVLSNQDLEDIKYIIKSKNLRGISSRLKHKSEINKRIRIEQKSRKS